MIRVGLGARGSSRVVSMIVKGWSTPQPILLTAPHPVRATTCPQRGSQPGQSVSEGTAAVEEQIADKLPWTIVGRLLIPEGARNDREIYVHVPVEVHRVAKYILDDT